MIVAVILKWLVQMIRPRFLLLDNLQIPNLFEDNDVTSDDESIASSDEEHQALQHDTSLANPYTFLQGWGRDRLDRVSDTLLYGAGATLMRSGYLYLDGHLNQDQTQINRSLNSFGLATSFLGFGLMARRYNQYRHQRQSMPQETESTPDPLPQRLDRLHLSEACIFSAIDLVTFACHEAERPPMNGSEALCLADYLRTLVCDTEDEIQPVLRQAALNAQDDPFQLLANLLEVARARAID